MPTKMYDLGEKPSTQAQELKREKKKWYPSIYIDAKQIPELVDYDGGDEIIFVIKAHVKSVTDTDGKRTSMDIEMRQARIENTKAIRERSYDTGLSVKDQKEVEGKK